MQEEPKPEDVEEEQEESTEEKRSRCSIYLFCSLTSLLQSHKQSLILWTASSKDPPGQGHLVFAIQKAS